MSGDPRFSATDRVRVQKWVPPGHVRAPFYIRGRSGVIESYVGKFRNPEDLAYGRRDGELVPLYRVGFASSELWPDCDQADGDRLVVDIYENWLEAEEKP